MLNESRTENVNELSIFCYAKPFYEKKKFKGNIFLDGNVESMDHLFHLFQVLIIGQAL